MVMLDEYDDDAPAAAKRPRSQQDDVIERTLAEDEVLKRARKAEKGGGEPRSKGKTLQEIEDEEGGTIKESMLGIAQAKRAASRKKAEAADEDDTDMPAEIDDRFEEDKLEVEEEGGIKFMPFSLAEEREIGHFDAEGNFVEDKVRDKDKDAWLDSAEVVSDKVKEMIAQRQKQEEELEAGARAAAPMTDRQIAVLKVEMARAMLPGETVAKAMKRIGGGGGGGGAAGGGGGGGQKALGKREKLRLQQQQQVAVTDGTASAATPAAAADLQLFDRFTEITDQLFAEGETDMYVTTREELERSAAMWLPKQPPAATIVTSAAATTAPGTTSSAQQDTAAAAAAIQGGPVAAAAGDDGDDDMFAEAEEQPASAEPSSRGAGASAAASMPASAESNTLPRQAGPASAAAQLAPPTAILEPAAATAPCTDFSAWPIRELVRFLNENGVDAAGIVEKGELVARAGEVELQVNATAAAAAADGVAGAAAAAVPAGYVFDAVSGYWHSAATGLYYDATSGTFYDGARWLSFNESTGEYQPL